RRGNRGEIASHLRWIRNCSEKRSPLSLTEPFKRAKEKCFISDNGSASCCAILIAAELRLCGIEELAGVEVIVAKEFIDTCVEVVRARSRDCRHNRLSLPELGREGIAIDLEFLNRVDIDIQ